MNKKIEILPDGNVKVSNEYGEYMIMEYNPYLTIENYFFLLDFYLAEYKNYVARLN